MLGSEPRNPARNPTKDPANMTARSTSRREFWAVRRDFRGHGVFTPGSLCCGREEQANGLDVMRAKWLLMQENYRRQDVLGAAGTRQDPRIVPSADRRAGLRPAVDRQEHQEAPDNTHGQYGPSRFRTFRSRPDWPTSTRPSRRSSQVRLAIPGTEGHDGFPPTIIAAVDALSAWGINRPAPVVPLLADPLCPRQRHYQLLWAVDQRVRPAPAYGRPAGRTGRYRGMVAGWVPAVGPPGGIPAAAPRRRTEGRRADCRLAGG